jgi:molecular chaperone GrpE
MTHAQERQANDTAGQKAEQPDAGAAKEYAGEDFDPGSATPEQWLSLLEKKDEEIRQLKDRVLRIAAEMDNTRKRLERERTDAVTYANENIIREMLPIVDNLERALQHGEKDANKKSLLEGVAITLKGFKDTLARFGCASFEATGKVFDPNLHEAVMQQEAGEHPENTVLQEVRKGYLLHERLLRPAMVVVSKLPKKPSGQAMVSQGEQPDGEPAWDSV